MRTFVSYMYRDASNFKKHGEFIVEGELLFSDLKPYLIDTEFFIPEHVGIEYLRPTALDEWDHALHEFVGFGHCDKTDGGPYISAEELIHRFRLAKAVQKVWA